MRSRGRLGLLRGHSVASMLREHVEYYKLAHQAGVEADPFELMHACALSYLPQGVIDIGEKHLVAHRLGEGSVGHVSAVA